MLERKTYKLPLAADYVSHWGFWEAVRELYQNALDAQDSIDGVTASLDYDELAGTLSVRTMGARLKPSMLVLGGSSKPGSGARGQFGEGMKLALLVLLRLGYTVHIRNGPGEYWVPQFEYDEDFDAEILTIFIEKREDSGEDADDFSLFLISTVSELDWEQVDENIMVSGPDSTLLRDPAQAGRIYHGGLYVCTMKDFKFGYCISPKDMMLDRDRGMVDGFDLGRVTSKLWEKEDPNEVYALVKDEVPDVQYLQYYASSGGSSLARGIFRTFVGKYPNTVPVSTQQEVEEAQAAGVKWQLVPSAMKRILSSIRHFVIPSSKPPGQRLKDFISKHRGSLTDQQKAELEDIVRQLEPQPRPEDAQDG